jgi:hypothetical protein
VITSVATTPVTSDLVAQIAKRVDADNDGSISTTEFAKFLTDLIGAVSQNASTKSLSGLASASGLASPLSIEDTPLPPCPAGWDGAKWTNPNHTTPKYVVGRILWRYPPSPESLAEALPAVQARYPGTTQVGQDKLQIPEWGLIDVGVDFGPGHGQSWAWQVVG